MDCDGGDGAGGGGLKMELKLELLISTSHFLSCCFA